MLTELLPALIGALILLLLSAMLSVLSALLDRSGSIRLEHWAGEAGGEIAALFKKHADFELFRAQLSWAATAFLVASLFVLVTSMQVHWTIPNALLVTVLFGVAVLAIELFARARVGHDPESALRRATPVLRAALFLLRPTIPLLRPLLPSSVIRRRDEETPDEATSDEIEAFLRVGEQEGILEPGEDDMVRGIVDFGETEVRSVMVPRTDMVTASPDDQPESLADLLLETGHSRLPLYDEDDDQVVGILHIRSLLQGMRSDPETPVSELARAPYFVAENARLDDLLRDLQSRHQQMAIVVDEYGGIAGLVTIEDLLEEIVGEIRDEYDVFSGELTEQLGRDRWRLDGGAAVDDLTDLFQIELAEASAATIGGLVLEILGRIPEVGERVQVEGVELTVERVHHRRVLAVRAERVAGGEARSQGEESR